MSMDTFDRLSAPEVPDLRSLVTRAGTENALMSRVPDGLVDRKFMLEGLFGARLQLGSVPEFDRSVKRGRQDPILVDMVPLNVEDLALVAFGGDDRSSISGRHHVPQLNLAITAG